MKLAFCLFKYYPYGGLEQSFLNITRQALACGHEVHVFTRSQLTHHLCLLFVRQ